MSPEEFGAVFVALKALGTIGIAAFVAIVIVDILKAKGIPINVPDRWQPILAGLLSVIQSVAMFILAGSPAVMSAAFAVAAMFLPAGAHAVFSKARKEPATPAPTTVANVDEIGAAVAAALPAPAPPMVFLSTPPPAADVPAPATGGSS